jgi:hypothetical protein
VLESGTPSRLEAAGERIKSECLERQKIMETVIGLNKVGVSGGEEAGERGCTQ